MAQGISKYIEALRGGVTKQNFDALYLVAFLIAFHTFRNCRFEPENATADNIALRWFKPFQGAKAIAQAAPLALMSSAFASIFPGVQFPLRRCFHQSHECAFGFLLEGLIGDEPDYEIYQYATSHMCSVLYCCHVRFFLRFLVDAPIRLSELLRLKDPRSLLIAYAFFSLMKTVPKDIWWLDGAADREVDQIRSVLPKTCVPVLEQVNEVVLGLSTRCNVEGLHMHGQDGELVPLVSLLRPDWSSRTPETPTTTVTEQELL
jgi:hypothetical protein